jgi:restriction endonuclease S subunit
MLTFDRVIFEKNISTSVKKKVKIESKWEIVRLGEICNLYQPKTITSQEIKQEGKYKVFGANGIIGFYDEYNHANSEVAITCRGATCGTINYTEPKSWITGNAMVAQPNNDRLNKRFLFHLLSSMDLFETITGTAQPQITRTTLEPYKIPLPPKEIQEKIVAEIEVQEKKEEKAKEEISTYKTTIWNLVNATFQRANHELLSNLCDSVEYGTSAKSEKTGGVPVIRMGNIQDGKINWDDLVYTNDAEEISKYSLRVNDVLFNRTNSPELVGKVCIYKGERPAIFAGYLIRINYKKELLNPVFLAYVLNSEIIRNYGFSVMSKSVNQANINGTLLKSYRIPCPPLSEQQKIVSEIEKIEIQINELKQQIAKLPQQKEEILKKYL